MNSILRLTACCLIGGPVFAGESTPTLKSAFSTDFLIGAAINADMTKSGNAAHALLLRHFNSITPTNLLKWGPYNPQPGVFNEEAAEAYFAFGKANAMYTVGHNLFWHQQTPPWVFLNDRGGDASREVLLQRMRDRVRHLAKLYGTRTSAWDVVNEAFLDDGSLRVSPFTRILGDDFLTEAFRIAQEELPSSVALLYNDYSLEAPTKVQAVVRLIEKLRSQGLRVDAIGNQAHWRLDSPTIEQIEASLLAFKAAHVKVHYTELDIEMLPRNVTGAEISARAALTAENNPFPNGLPAAQQERLAQRYAQIFTLFHKYADVIDRVTFWGVTDADSWLNNWPVRGRTNYPLLFDRSGQPKPAFEAVLKAATKQP